MKPKYDGALVYIPQLFKQGLLQYRSIYSLVKQGKTINQCMKYFSSPYGTNAINNLAFNIPSILLKYYKCINHEPVYINHEPVYINLGPYFSKTFFHLNTKQYINLL